MFLDILMVKDSAVEVRVPCRPKELRRLPGTDPMGTADAIGEKHRRDLSCSEFCFQGQSQT